MNLVVSGGYKQSHMGSRAGIPHKSTLRVAFMCQERGYDSIDAMIDAAEIALRCFIEDRAKEDSGRISPMESKANDYLKTYVAIATTVAKFIYPQRKAIEVTQADATQGMSPEQKLEAMKQAVQLLELQVKQNGSGTS